MWVSRGCAHKLISERLPGVPRTHYHYCHSILPDLQLYESKTWRPGALSTVPQGTCLGRRSITHRFICIAIKDTPRQHIKGAL